MASVGVSNPCPGANRHPSGFRLEVLARWVVRLRVSCLWFPQARETLPVSGHSSTETFLQIRLQCRFGFDRHCAAQRIETHSRSHLSLDSVRWGRLSAYLSDRGREKTPPAARVCPHQILGLDTRKSEMIEKRSACCLKSTRISADDVTLPPSRPTAKAWLH